MILNRNNFIQWYNSTNVSTLARVRLGSSGQCNPIPLWVVGDTMKIYFNAANKFSATGTLSLVTLANTEVAADVGSLTSLTIVGGNHSYGTLTCPSVPNGLYRLKTGGGLLSNSIRIFQTRPTESMLVEFSHSGNLISDWGSFLYKGTSITQRFLLPLISYESGFDNSRESYEESTTRNIRVNNQRTKRWIKFRSEYVDDETIQAFASMLTHDTITINGVPVVAKDGGFLETEYDPLEKLNIITFTMYEKESTLASVI